MSRTVPDPKRGRIELLDVLRGVALLSMLVYHFTWDLEFFGYLPAGTAVTGGWRLFARGIATSFLVLVGIGIYLAHANGVRWAPFTRRLMQIAAGALAITVATALFTPGSFVFFGILHQIAVASVLALAFLRLPFWLTAIVAVAVVALPTQIASPWFDSRWLAWIGFSQTEPLSNDFVPVFPWSGAVLAGLALGQLCAATKVFGQLRQLNPTLAFAAPLGTLGRHSLAFYLIHQPVSIAVVAGFAAIFPPDQTARFGESCRLTCSRDADASFCERYCGCVQRGLEADTLLERLMRQDLNEADATSVDRTVELCSFDPSAR